MNHTDRIRAPLRFGVNKTPSIIYRVPNGESSTFETSFSAAWCNSALTRSSHASEEKPIRVKNSALLRPSRCLVESKYPVIFISETTAFSQLGSFNANPSVKMVTLSSYKILSKAETLINRVGPLSKEGHRDGKIYGSEVRLETFQRCPKRKKEWKRDWFRIYFPFQVMDIVILERYLFRVSQSVYQKWALNTGTP